MFNMLPLDYSWIPKSPLNQFHVFYIVPCQGGGVFNNSTSSPAAYKWDQRRTLKMQKVREFGVPPSGDK